MQLSFQARDFEGKKRRCLLCARHGKCTQGGEFLRIQEPFQLSSKVLFTLGPDKGSQAWLLGLCDHQSPMHGMSC